MTAIESLANKMSREEFVLRISEANFAGMIDEVLGARGSIVLEDFAKHAESRARALSREYSRVFVGNEAVLTKHANHSRTISANILLLRDGYVPAIKIDLDNTRMRTEACRIMAYLYIQFQAMESYFR